MQRNPSCRVRRAPHPAQRGRGEPGTDLGHEALVLDVALRAALDSEKAGALKRLSTERQGSSSAHDDGPAEPAVAALT